VVLKLCTGAKKLPYFAQASTGKPFNYYLLFMKKYLFLCAAVWLLASSCASLSKSQVEAVNQFAQTSKSFSAYPSQLLVAMADLRVKRGVYFVNSLENPGDMEADEASDNAADSLREQTVDDHVKELESVYAAKKSDYTASAKINITFLVIDKYAQALLLLSSDKHAAGLAEQAANFGMSLDSLIGKYNSLPGTTKVRSGIGGLVGSLVMAGGKQFVRAKQAKEIQRFVPAADEMIGVMTGNLLEFLQSGSISTLIANEEKGISSNYKSFLRHRNPAIQHEWDYLDQLAHLDKIKALRNQTVAATTSLRIAHAELLTAIKEKKTLTEGIAELQALYENVKQVRTTIHEMYAAKK
jgi:hypothetical protein